MLRQRYRTSAFGSVCARGIIIACDSNTSHSSSGLREPRYDRGDSDGCWISTLTSTLIFDDFPAESDAGEIYIYRKFHTFVFFSRQKQIKKSNMQTTIPFLFPPPRILFRFPTRKIPDKNICLFPIKVNRFMTFVQFDFFCLLLTCCFSFLFEYRLKTKHVGSYHRWACLIA